MLLSPPYIPMVKAALDITRATGVDNIVITLRHSQERITTIDVSAGGVLIKATYPDTNPVIEYYRNPMGLALAYRIPLQQITNLSEGS